MFRKDFKVKSNSTIKGSERKRLRNEIRFQFPSLSSEEISVLVPNREELNQVKIFTHSGEIVKVYYLGRNPIFFQAEGKLFPTVYTLWNHPDLLPSYTTWPPVIENICNGADLMLPGVVLTEGTRATERLENIKSGDVCSVCLVGNRAPVAVGTSAISSDQVFASDRKGKAVIIVHVYGDKLWATGEKTQVVQLDEEKPFADCVDSKDSLAEPHVEEAATNGMSRLGMQDVISEEEINREECCNELPEAVEEKQPTESMDSVLMKCFLTAMKTTMKKAELPLLASTFYSAYVLAACPPNVDTSLDIKKTSYKKVSNFLEEMHRQGFIHLQNLSKGVQSIVGVNFDHEMIKAFRPKLVETKETADKPDVYVPPQITELYCVSAAVLPLFKDKGLSKGAPLTAAEVRQWLKDYAKENELHVAGNPREVKLDPILANIMLGKDEYQETLAWEEFFSRILAKMSKAHKIQFEGKPAQFRKGILEPIDITVMQRSGNKKVTLIHNLEWYGIDPENFAHQVQVGVAASTSVSPSFSGKRGSQVLVQGNQTRYIGKLLLDEYKLPRKYVQGLDKALSSKNKK